MTLATGICRVLFLAAVLPFAASAGAAGLTDAMRGPTPLDAEPAPPALGNAENKDVRRNRAFAMQPPTIPHKIDGYQLDRSANRCLSCHSRTKSAHSSCAAVSRWPS